MWPGTVLEAEHIMVSKTRHGLCTYKEYNLVDTTDWMFVPPKIHILKISSMRVFGDGAFRRWLGHDGRAFINEISAQDLTEIFFAICHVKTQQKGSCESSPDTEFAGALSWISQPLELWKINLLFINYPVYSISIIAVQTD